MLKKYIENFLQQKLAIIQDDLQTNGKSAFFAPAQNITAQSINIIIKNTGGIFTVSISNARAEQFGFPYMGTGEVPMTVSVEARNGVTTGISASDRAVTIGILGEEIAERKKLVQPGHIFPVVSAAGGVLAKHDLFNAGLDFSLLAGFNDAALVVELIDNATGKNFTNEKIQTICSELSIPLITMSSLIAYKMQATKLVEKVAEAKLPTFYSKAFKAVGFRSIVDEGDHIALVKGEININEPILCRVQAEDLIGDILGGDNSSRDTIKKSLELIEKNQIGVFIYLRKPEKNNKSKTTISSVRAYGIGCQILKQLGVNKIKSITTSASPHVGLEHFGIEVLEYIRI